MGRWKKWMTASIIGMSILVFPGMALASSYSISYDFDSNLTGPHRSFNGQNIEVELQSNYDNARLQPNDTFKVQLYRDHWYGADYIGEGTAWSDGYSVIKWSNVGAGTYNLEMHHNTYGYYIHGEGTEKNY